MLCEMRPEILGDGIPRIGISPNHPYYSGAEEELYTLSLLQLLSHPENSDSSDCNN